MWPLLGYAVLVAIAAARRGVTVTEPAQAAADGGAARQPYRAIYPAVDEKIANPAEASPAAPADPDKRPREQFENDQPIVAQLSRAREKGRGRRATAPWQIPWRGWNDIFWRVYASFNDNRLLAVAGGVVFFSLLAIFPAVAAFVSLYGLIADASTIDAHLSLAAGVLPAGAVELLHEQITKLAAKGDARLSFGFITGLVIALWSANAGMKAIIDALNVVYRREGKTQLREAQPSSPCFSRSSRIFSLHARARRRCGHAPIVFPPSGFRPFRSAAIAILRWPLLLDRWWPSPWPRSIAMGRAAPSRAGDGSRSEASPRRLGG